MPNPKFIPIADGCCRDVSRQYLRDDGVWCFLEWTPTLNPDNRLPFAEAVSLAQQCELAGGGWSAPDAHQLQSIVDYSRFDPAIDTSVPTFADTKGWYWTGTVDPSSPSGGAYGVYFLDGCLGWGGHGLQGFVRACRLVPASQ